MRVGADIGGTFTDVTLIEAQGRIHRSQVLTTPHDPARAVLQGLQQVVQAAQTDISQVDRIIHGTTLVINALIERPSPLVPPALRYPLPERIYSDGRVVTLLDPQAVRTLIATLRREQVQAVAVCLLHSYKNPQHEQMVAEILQREALDLYLTLSSDLVPEIREYPRTSTTVANVGGQMRLDTAAASQAIAEQIAAPLGLDPVAAAWGMHQVVNENMARAAWVHPSNGGKSRAATPSLPLAGRGQCMPVTWQRFWACHTSFVPWAPGWPRPLACYVRPRF